MIVLSQREVAALLPMSECIDVMAGALSGLTRGDAILPLRTVLRLPNGTDGFALMPAYVKSPAAIGAKLITIFPGNHGTDRDSHQGAVLLFDAANGSLSAMLDATAITSIRTAAVSALATRHLARSDADDLAIIGSGVQARMHLEAIPLVREIRRARIWSRDRARALALCRPNREASAFPIEVCETAEAAVRGASIICATTASSTPVVLGEWIAEGAHVNAVGSSTPGARELDTAAVARARIFVDSRVSALNEAGDIIIPMREGAITADRILAELGEIVAGQHPGRQSDGDVTLFKSLGLAVEDIAAAQHVCARAVERSVGTVIDIGGVRHAHA